jgi:hypothetical protein
MRKIGILSLVLGFLALLLLPQAVSAQADVVTIDIPFAFLVGDTMLPAGTYQITKIKDGNYRIANLKGDQKAMFMTETATNPTPVASFTLMFNAYGDQYYLSKFFHQGMTVGDALRQTAAEKELALKVKPTTKIVEKGK